jgi:hypothetical protein
MRQQTRIFQDRNESVDWPRYSRPPGRVWEMKPHRRVLYENPWAQEQADWKADQILRMFRRHNIFPKDACEVGVLSKIIIEKLQGKLGSSSRIWGHEVPLQDLELNDCRADPVLRRFLDEIQTEHPSAFEVFIALDVMEHIEDYHGFLRAVRPMGAYKLFHLPMDLTVQTIMRPKALMRRRDTFLHISYFTKETIIRTLQDTGYEVIDSFYTPWRIQFAKELTGRLMKIPRQLLFAISPDAAVRYLGGYSLMILAK